MVNSKPFIFSFTSLFIFSCCFMSEFDNEEENEFGEHTQWNAVCTYALEGVEREGKVQ